MKRIFIVCMLLPGIPIGGLKARELTLYANGITGSPFMSADGLVMVRDSVNRYGSNGVWGASSGGNSGGSLPAAYDDVDAATLSLSFDVHSGMTELGSILTRATVTVSGFAVDPGVTVASGIAEARWNPAAQSVVLRQDWTCTGIVRYRFANPGASAGRTLVFSFSSAFGEGYRFGLNHIGYGDARTDHDGDGLTDDVDEDDDGDGVIDAYDNCPLDSNPAQMDLDGDGVGDVSDLDDDDDGTPDSVDNSPEYPNPDQLDTDDDGIGDVTDTDADNDGLPEWSDPLPLDPFNGAPSSPWRFEYSGGLPVRLVWQTEVGREYNLTTSSDLVSWTRIAGFPRVARGAWMGHSFVVSEKGFFRMIYTGDGFVRIPEGSFQMGDGIGDGWAEELPVHQVTVGEFLMGKHEVSRSLWQEVRAWGQVHGYTDLPQGSGKAASHPVQNVNWWAAVKWCNARSERDGLAPCYRVAGEVFRTGSDTPDCDWIASGYRLPTEAEWEKAARGGLVGQRFPSGYEITHDFANYQSTSSLSYDVSKTRGFHPIYNDGIFPYTSPTGVFEANGYGLHDMVGNVWEWCWDWYGPYPSSAEPDPRGPTVGTDRIFRGGSWFESAEFGRVSFRNFSDPVSVNVTVGFRPVRLSSP